MDALEIRRKVKTALVENDLTLAAVARFSGRRYDRLSKIVNGMRSPQPGEVEGLLGEIDRLAKMYNGPRAEA